MFASGVSDHYIYFKVDEKFLKEETIHAKGIHYHLCSKLELTKAPFQFFYIHSLDDVISNTRHQSSVGKEIKCFHCPHDTL